MEETWRWFGDQDPISLDYIKMTGASGVVTALHDVPAGSVWTLDQICKKKNKIAAAGLRWSVCESIWMDDRIKFGGAAALPVINAWKDSLANLGRAGIKVVCYNFMPVVDWTRTDLKFPLPGGGYALRFDMIDFIVYDVFVLKRPNARDFYDAGLVDKALLRFNALDDEEILQLERNIIAGLPGGANEFSRQTIADRINAFNGIDAATMRRNLKEFLSQVVPVAEEFGVKLAIHPDDPPVPLFGLPRIVSNSDDIKFILSAVKSPMNGITLCTGSYGANPDNDLVSMAKTFSEHIHFAHLRNIQAQEDGSFFEAEHLQGAIDMVGVIDVLLKEEARRSSAGETCALPIRPDHGHLLAGDISTVSNPGYSYIGRLKGLAELRGVILTLQHEKAA